MPLILPGNVASATAAVGFDVENSCRFNRTDSAYMHKAFGAPTSVDRWTISFWVKRGTLGDGASGTEQNIWGTISDDGTSNVDCRFNSEETNNSMRWTFYQSSSTVAKLQTTQLFQDCSAWYHMVNVWDSGNATAGDRMKWYVNGAEVTAFSTDTNPDEDLDSFWNSDGSIATIGSFRDTDGSRGLSAFGDFYLAEFVFCDGQAYAASDFGEFDSDSPTIWKPTDPSGLTFGNNGFYLDFKDSANLGNDANGGTDLTEVNIAAADQTTDTPTNNFCTMNPLDNFWGANIFSEGNCHIVTPTAKRAAVSATIGLTAGKWYWEVKPTTLAGSGGMIGIISRLAQGQYEYVGDEGDAIGKKTSSTQYESNGAGNYTTYGTTIAADDIIGVALDLDNSKLYFSKGGTWMDDASSVTGVPTSGSSGTGAISITAVASTRHEVYFPAVSDRTDEDAQAFSINFGNPPYANSSDAADENGYGAFEYAPPSGYLAICTKNLGSDGG
jgi:hypothetical protein